MNNRRLVSVALAAALALIALAAVAGRASASPRAHGAARAQLTVYAAASLTDVFPKIDPSQKYSFGGSNALAAQITLGAPADVFASANMTLPNQLFAKGLCSQPVAFTRNTLVIVVPTANPANIHSVYDLTKPGVKLDVAGPGVPVGSYTLQILKNMNLTAAVTKNIVSQETDVREVLAKVALGEADAGFVYSTDAKTVPGQGEGAEGARLGSAQGAVRHLRRLEERRQDRRAGVHQQGARARPGRRSCSPTASCPGSSRSPSRRSA